MTWLDTFSHLQGSNVQTMSDVKLYISLSKGL